MVVGKQGDDGLGPQVGIARAQRGGQLLRAALGVLDGLDQDGDRCLRRRQEDGSHGRIPERLLTLGYGRVGGEIHGSRPVGLINGLESESRKALYKAGLADNLLPKKRPLCVASFPSWLRRHSWQS